MKLYRIISLTEFECHPVKNIKNMYRFEMLVI